MTPLWAGEKAFGAAGVPQGELVTVKRRKYGARPGSTVAQLGPWAEAATHQVAGVGLDRTQSNPLIGDSGDSDVVSALIFCPANADILNGDRVEFPGGVIVEVEGIPDRSKNFFTGWRPPMTVTVKVTHG